MTSWQVSESAATIGLDPRGRGTVTFTVTNPGPDQDRAVLSLTPLDGAVREWFVVEEPQRTIAAGDSAVYVVNVEVPEGTAAGSYALQAVIYSADRDPAETSTTSRRISFEVASSDGSPFPWWVLAVLAVLLAVIGLVAWQLLDDDGTPPETGSPTTVPPTSGTTSSSSTSSSSTSSSTTSSTTPRTTDPSGPDLQFSRVFECSVVRGGALSGADNLTLFVQLRNGGPGSVERTVPMLVESDTGLRSTSNSAVGTGRAFNPLSVDLIAADYDQAHRFTIVADPDNEIVESDESNNALQITVDLGSQPSSSTDVPCSPS